MGVIISSVLNPEVGRVSRCQGRFGPEGVICSHSSAPLPVCLERENNDFSITRFFYSRPVLSPLRLSPHHYLPACRPSCLPSAKRCCKTTENSTAFSAPTRYFCSHYVGNYSSYCRHYGAGVIFFFLLISLATPKLDR